MATKASLTQREANQSNTTPEQHLNLRRHRDGSLYQTFQALRRLLRNGDRHLGSALPHDVLHQVPRGYGSHANERHRLSPPAVLRPSFRMGRRTSGDDQSRASGRVREKKSGVRIHPPNILQRQRLPRQLSSHSSRAPLCSQRDRHLSCLRESGLHQMQARLPPGTQACRRRRRRGNTSTCQEEEMV